ncbi:MAG: thiazole synthase [Bacteroidales bacterium]|nr:thiazole synthase [Bacteroidales bacterium]
MDKLIIAGKIFKSRLILGTGKFSSNKIMSEAIVRSNCEMVTTALKRINIEENESDDMLQHINREKIQLLPNTSGVRTAKEAIFAAQIAAEALQTKWIKLEIHPDPKYLLPDPIETFEATKELVKLGFVVLPYCSADPVLCKRLEEVGAAAVMPLGAAIGTNKGLKTKDMLEIILTQSNIPVIIDAGIGSPSQAAEAMEIGASAVMVNTAIAIAEKPVEMACAFAKAIEAGREAFESGLAIQTNFANATSPLTSFLD